MHIEHFNDDDHNTINNLHHPHNSELSITAIMSNNRSLPNEHFAATPNHRHNNTGNSNSSGDHPTTGIANHNQHVPSRAPLPVQSDHDLDSNSKSTFRGGGDGGGAFNRRGGQIRINRNTMSLASLERVHPPEEAYRARREIVRRMLPEKWSACSTLRSVFPILKWLPNYDARADLSSDFVAGLTTLALQIPQGLAYSKLAGVQPAYGLFATFYSMSIFALMSTSRHVSMGLYAITSMMCRGVVQRYNDTHPDESPITILVTLCLMTGIIQTLFGVLRLGNLTLLFSDNFLSAFTVGCTILILNSQLPPTLGISFSPDENKDWGIPSECLNSWISIIRHIPDCNPITLGLSFGVLFILISCKFYFEPEILLKRFNSNFSVPVDLIVIILTIIISMFASLGEKGVEIVGEIPAGFRPPTLPRLDLIPALLMEAVIMAVVASVCQISMSKMLAKKYCYKISLNQEFLAYGTTNIFCSFFQCFPTCASLARTNVNENAGARTQMSTIVTTSLLVVFLLFFTSYLGPLPKATLSSIIIVAMLPSITMFRDFLSILYVSRFDAMLWMVTFLTVTFLGVNVGIYCGLVTSIAIILIRAAIPTSSIKYPLTFSELYFPPDVFNGLSSQALQKYRVAVFSFNGPLTFLSAATFRSDVRRMILNNDSELMNDYSSEPIITILEADANNNDRATVKTSPAICKPSRGGAFGKLQVLQTLILDMSQINYIDVTGIEMLNDLKDELMEQNIQLFLACPSISVLSTLERAQFFVKSIPKEHCFMSIIDGVTFAADPNATHPYSENGRVPAINGFDKMFPKQ